MRKYYIVLGTLVILMGSIFFGHYQGKVEANENIYIVQAEDTLYSISTSYGVTVEDLQRENGMSGTVINVGQRLLIPVIVDSSQYSVKPGDTLYTIANNSGLTVEKLKSLNNLEDDLIVVGQKLHLGKPVIVAMSTATLKGIRPENKLSAEDIELLARMIHAEARGESYEGKVAVGAVILNRIDSPDFPSTMREVIYQPTKNGYQFSPVQNGSINLKPDEISIKAAYDAVRGLDPTGGSLYFYNPDLATDQWITTVPVTKRIGNHLFAR